LPDKVNAVPAAGKTRSTAITLGQSAIIVAHAKTNGRALIYTFGSDAGILTVKGNTATLSTAGITNPGTTQVIRVVCSALDLDGQTSQQTVAVSFLPIPTDLAPQIDVSVSAPPVSKVKFSGTIAPSLAWITGTQTQTTLGGNAILGLLHAKQPCDSSAWQLGVEALASNTTTRKLGGSPTHLDSDDGRISGLRAILGDGTTTKDYVGGTADYFVNNSLGIGLQQTYSAAYQHYLTECADGKNLKDIRQNLSVAAGAGFVIERFYKTSASVTSAVTPVSAQYSWSWWHKSDQDRSLTTPQLRLMFSFQAAWMPLLSNTHDYQLYERSSVSLPTPNSHIQFTFDHLDYYVNNAPPSFKRNYQNVSLGIKIILNKPDKNALPTDVGACWSGDQIKRLSCIENVARSQCTGTSNFRAGELCNEVVPLTHESQ
jgi:hypothetical protein